MIVHVCHIHYDSRFVRFPARHYHPHLKKEITNHIIPQCNEICPGGKGVALVKFDYADNP